MRERLPHGVEKGAVIFQPQQLVRCSHVMRNGFFPIKKEGVRGPDVTGQQIIQRKHLHRAFKAKPFIFPALAEEHINSVLLWEEKSSVLVYVSSNLPDQQQLLPFQCQTLDQNW